MTPEEFLALVKYYGEQNILAIGFDNSAGKTFREGEFTLANCWVDSLGCLQFVEYDRKGIPFHVIKPVATIQSVAIVDSGYAFNKYEDVVTYRG